MAREDLTNTEDMRYQLLDYCYGVVNQTRNDADGTSLGVVPEDVAVEPFDSLFEQRVYNRIVDRGYTVHAQYPAHGYNIDMVIIGAKGKLAVECDGDFWHGPDVYEADLARQRELERCGWEFFRIRESVFYADMPSSLKKLWDTLDELDIRTADWIDPSFDEEVSDEIAEAIDDLLIDETIADVADVGDALGELNSLIDADLMETTEDSNSAEVNGEPSSSGRHRAVEPGNLAPNILDETDDRHSAAQVPTLEAEQLPESEALVVADEPIVESVLRPYVAFAQNLPPVNQSSLSEMEAHIVSIVAAEGPVLGHRIHNAYRDAYGGQRVGKEIARLLNRAISIAERHGHITSDNPLNDSGLKPRTFRLPSQPAISPRELGPRGLDLVPPSELAHHLSNLALDDDLQSEEELFRAVLDRLGLIRLTENARSVLTAATALMTDANREASTTAPA
jgi:very-short-patch-repair endonuclease